MNYNYNTSFRTPPIGSQLPPDLWKGSPYQYGSAHRDVMNSVGGANSAAFDISATRADTDNQLAAQEARRQLVLQGLQQASRASQDQQNLQNSRLQSLTGTANSLLGGLFS